MGIKTTGKSLGNLRFVDDMFLFAENKKQKKTAWRIWVEFNWNGKINGFQMSKEKESSFAEKC